MKQLFLAALVAGGTATPLAAAPLEVRTFPITAFQAGTTETRFGALEFLGGLQVVSPNADFGSLSGIDFMPDGTLVAVADTGFWFTARLIEDNGRPTGLTNATLTPMRGLDGKPPARKIDADAEGLRLVTSDGKTNALVSFEQTSSVRNFAGPDFAAAKPTRVRLPKFVSGLRRNQGLEAIAVAPAESPLAGSTVVIAERSLDERGNHRGFVLSGPKAGAFTIRNKDEFDVSDAAFLPNGDLLVLERRFSFSGGFAARIRRLAGDAIRPGALVDGTDVLLADGGYQIDNLEGLAVRVMPDGRTLLTLVSDDNGTFLQRTLILQFAFAAP